MFLQVSNQHRSAVCDNGWYHEQLWHGMGALGIPGNEWLVQSSNVQLLFLHPGCWFSNLLVVDHYLEQLLVLTIIRLLGLESLTATIDGNSMEQEWFIPYSQPGWNAFLRPQGHGHVLGGRSGLGSSPSTNESPLPRGYNERYSGGYSW